MLTKSKNEVCLPQYIKINKWFILVKKATKLKTLAKNGLNVKHVKWHFNFIPIKHHNCGMTSMSVKQMTRIFSLDVRVSLCLVLKTKMNFFQPLVAESDIVHIFTFIPKNKND